MNSPAASVANVLYEDDCLVAFDKPTGMLVAPDRWDKERVNLMGRLHELVSTDYMNVHRLDRETSGVFLCAKHPDFGTIVARQFENHEVEKVYVAITRDGPQAGQGVLDFPLDADPERLGCMRIHGQGKPSRTRFQVVERFKARYNLIEAMPETGRTHQIRVHLAQTGAPIVGDRLYGDGRGVYLSDLKRNYHSRHGQERPLLDRLALHAMRLTVSHPRTGERLTIEAPLPNDFDVALKYLERYPA